MRSLILYSSFSGNTKKIAEAIFEIMPEGTCLAPVQEAPDPNDYDLIILGFWVRKAAPDPRMMRYMKKIKGKNLGLFGTMGAYPDSEHAEKTAEKAKELVEGNNLLGIFLCQGKLSEKMSTLMGKNKDMQRTHPMTPRRLAQRLEAAKHPNKEDFKAAQETFKNIYTEAKKLFLAKRESKETA